MSVGCEGLLVGCLALSVGCLSFSVGSDNGWLGLSESEISSQCQRNRESSNIHLDFRIDVPLHPQTPQPLLLVSLSAPCLSLASHIPDACAPCPSPHLLSFVASQLHGSVQLPSTSFMSPHRHRHSLGLSWQLPCILLFMPHVSLMSCFPLLLCPALLPNSLVCQAGLQHRSLAA